MSGSPVANVATIGSFTIPLMKKVGYSAEYAAGVEAVSSNGGQVMPPVMGLVAFVMAGVTGFSYASICVAAIIPAILYYLAIFVQVDLQAAKRGLLGQPRDKLPSVGRTIKEGWYFAIPVVLLFYLMVGARVSPEQSALYGLLCALAVGMISPKYRFNVKRLVNVMMQITKMMVMPGISCAIAATLDSSLGFSGIGLQFSGLLVEWSHGSLIFLIFLTAIACYFLGLGLTAIASYIIVAALVAPALMDFGVNKMAVHFFVFYYAISSFITPPVAVAAFVAAGIANANPMSTGWRAMHLGIVAYIIPVYFIYDQTLLGYGPLYKVVLGGLAAAVGTVGLGVALEGFLWSRLNWFKRGLVAAGALLLIKPGIITGLSGACIIFGLIVYEFSRKRLSRREKAASVELESGGL